MKKNPGNADRTIRALIFVAVLVLFLLNAITAKLAYVLLDASVILPITSLINVCPIHAALGIKTNWQSERKVGLLSFKEIYFLKCLWARFLVEKRKFQLCYWIIVK